jgi:hypothetical protein
MKVVEVEFSLDRELVVRVKNVKCECGLGSFKWSGVPAYTQELAIVLDPSRRPSTSTELYIDAVNSTDVNHEENLRFWAWGRARGVLMTDVETVVEIFEGFALKKPSVPDLPEGETALFPDDERTSRRWSGRFSCWWMIQETQRSKGVVQSMHL